MEEIIKAADTGSPHYWSTFISICFHCSISNNHFMYTLVNLWINQSVNGHLPISDVYPLFPIEDKDGFVSPPEVLQCLQYLMGETQRREVDEDASGINGLLFEFNDLNKNGTIELSGKLVSPTISLFVGLNKKTCPWYVSQQCRASRVPLAQWIDRIRCFGISFSAFNNRRGLCQCSASEDIGEVGPRNDSSWCYYHVSSTT